MTCTEGTLFLKQNVHVCSFVGFFFFSSSFENRELGASLNSWNCHKHAEENVRLEQDWSLPVELWRSSPAQHPSRLQAVLWVVSLCIVPSRLPGVGW